MNYTMNCLKNSQSGNHLGYEDRDIQNDGTVIVKIKCAFCGFEIKKSNPEDYKTAASGEQ